jgi:hypothetical protein
MIGFQLGIELLSLFPVAFVNERALSEDQLHVGITCTAAGTNTSVLNQVWTRIDLFSTPALTDWYFALLATTVPTTDLCEWHPR